MLRELNFLAKFGIDEYKIKQYQILCLPENINSAEDDVELQDANDTTLLSKQLKVAGLKCANSYDLGLASGTYDRRGGDIWLGVVWVLDHFALPIFLGVVSNLITSRITSKSNQKRLEQTGSI